MINALAFLEMGWISRLLGKETSLRTATIPPLPPQRPSKKLELLPADWVDSPPHLAILQRFVKARDSDNGVPDYWKPMFGVDPSLVVAALVRGGALEEAQLRDKIEICNTGVQLKEMLASRGLKVSGKKADQVERLIGADPEGMKAAFGKRQLLRCSAEAALAVDAWKQKRVAALSSAADETILALRGKRFVEAIRIADSYKKERFELPVHPDQEAMTSKLTPKPLNERARELAQVFVMKPRILRGLSSEQWEGLYLNYSVWQLLGSSLAEKCMPGFDRLGSMDEATVTRMLHFYIRHVEDVEKWKRLGIKKAKISCCNSGSCDKCMAMDGKTYLLSKLPELPYENCSCAIGCRCLYLPELNF